MSGEDARDAASFPVHWPERVRQLLVAHLGRADFPMPRLEPWPGGGNNRVFRVEIVGLGYFLLKSYFTSPADPRDRLGAEWSFAKFAWESGIRAVPEPIACDPAERFALFEFVTGRGFEGATPSAADLREAGRFLGALQRRRETSAAQAILPASEACFSIARHADRIADRVRQLEQAAEDEPHSAPSQFVFDHLVPAAKQTLAWVTDVCRRDGRDAGAVLPSDERILSPSDFGFHNALRDEAGTIRFLDFEYAGWDDPAKTTCDYFLQVAVPVPRTDWGTFVAELEEGSQSAFGWRADLLFPLYQVKWCCIVLNPLLRAGLARARFSRSSPLAAEALAAQRLERATGILAQWKEFPRD